MRYEAGSHLRVSYLILHNSYLTRALSSSGRAIDLHSIGKEFDSPRVHKIRMPLSNERHFFALKTAAETSQYPPQS